MLGIPIVGRCEGFGLYGLDVGGLGFRAETYLCGLAWLPAPKPASHLAFTHPRPRLPNPNESSNP